MLLPEIPPEVTTVLLDVGGVLYVDPWETLVLSPERGLADRLGVDRERAAEVGASLWARFAVAPATEESYWEAFGEVCGRRIPLDVVAEVSDELLGPTPWAQDVLDGVSGRRLGVVTDNTAFWYTRQRRELALGELIDGELELTSFAYGMRKRSHPGLLEVAAVRCDVARTLFVDDRAANRERAEALGFRTAGGPA